MPIFPYYNQYNRRPYFYNNYYNSYRNINNGFVNPSNSSTNLNKSSVSAPFTNSTPKESSSSNSNISHSRSNEDVWLDLFGIQLYFDDVLILSLLFFLYNEEVKDEGLFLALVLLLIS